MCECSLCVAGNATSILCPTARDPACIIPANGEKTLRRRFKIHRHSQNEISHSRRTQNFNHLQNITYKHTRECNCSLPSGAAGFGAVQVSPVKPTVYLLGLHFD